MKSVYLTLIRPYQLLRSPSLWPRKAVGRGGCFGAPLRPPTLGGSNTTATVPSISYKGDGYSIALNQISVDVFSNRSISASALLKLRRSAFASTNTGDLSGIDRNHTADLGLRYQAKFRLDFRGWGECFTRHNGVSMAAKKLKAMEQIRMRPFLLPLAFQAGAKWQSDALAEYTYGVLGN